MRTTPPPDKQPAAETLERADRLALRINQRFVLYPTMDACADAAEPIFKANRWRWTRYGIPGFAEIMRTLLSLQSSAERSGQDYNESGRLVYYKGQFGHERSQVGPSGKESKS